MIHRIVRKSPHLTYPFHLMHEIRYISGSFSLLCATLFASVCVPAWAKTGHVTKPTTAKVVSVKNQKVLAGKNNPVKNQKNQDADISRPIARQNKGKAADKKTATPVQLARMDKNDKPNPAKHHTRLARSDTRPARSGLIARNEKFTDSVKQSAGKANKHDSSEKGLSVRDLQKQIATLQTSSKKRLSPCRASMAPRVLPHVASRPAVISPTASRSRLVCSTVSEKSRQCRIIFCGSASSTA